MLDPLKQVTEEMVRIPSLQEGSEPNQEISWQGELLIWKDKSRNNKAPKTKGRGQVKGFSDAARLRMLRWLATVDWPANEPFLWLTTTYPDQVGRPDGPDLAEHRKVFWRYLEAVAGKTLGCLWRLEWQERKSGERAGQLMPHNHILIFRTRFIDKEAIRILWAKAIRFDGTPMCWIERCDAGRRAALYAAKYAAKEASSVLDNTAYREIPCGRVWGVRRKELITLCDKVVSVFAPVQEIIDLHDELTEKMRRKHATSSSSFTILGAEAKKKGEQIFGHDPAPSEEA